MRKIIFIALVVIAAGVAAFMLLYHPKRINAISYSPDDYRNWPIMQVIVKANGGRIGFSNENVGGGIFHLDPT